MNRTDALRALIERMDADERMDLAPKAVAYEVIAAVGRGAFDGFWDAWRGSLDAVAKLEAPLLGPPLGWHQCIWLLSAEGWRWEVAMWNPHRFHKDDEQRIRVIADTEARARLLAVLRALLVEEGSK